MNTPNRHDADLAAWLERSTPSAGPPTPDCLDAETMAAWVDGGLDGAVLLQVQAHVAGCGHCQAVAAAIGRAGEVAATIDAPQASEWWRGWLRWAVPLTAAATAVVALAVWVRTPSPAQQTSAPASAEMRTPVGEMRAPTTANAAEPESSGDKASSAPDAAQRAASPGSAAPTSVAASPSLRDRPDTASAAPGATTAREQGLTSSEAVGRAEPETTARANALAPAPAAPPTRTEAFAQTSLTATADAQVRAKAAEPSPDVAASSRGAVAAAPGGLAESRQRVSDARADANWTIVAAPTGTMLWRFSRAGLQTSSDGGATWRAVVLENADNIRAGSALNAATCWMVGRGGFVARTLDGTVWTRVPFPDNSDLVTVNTSPDGVRVTTTTGRVYLTTDNGRYWRAL